MPTAISLLIVVAMAGKPIKCDRPGCVEKNYSWELLVLPMATASPFICGYLIAQMSSNKKGQYLKSQGGASEAQTP